MQFTRLAGVAGGAETRSGNSDPGRDRRTTRFFGGAVAAARSPRSEIVNVSLGRALMTAGSNGRNAEAVERFRAALKTNPDSAKVRFHLGLALRSLGRPAEALVELERLLSTSPGLEMMEQLADVYGEVGRFDDAIVLRQRIVVLRPGSAAVRYEHTERREDRQAEVTSRDGEESPEVKTKSPASPPGSETA